MLLQWLGFGLAFAAALAGVVAFFVRLVRDLEKKIDQHHQTLYDPLGMNGIVRKVKVMEETVGDLDLRFEQTESRARHDARAELQKVIENLERIYGSKRRP